MYDNNMATMLTGTFSRWIGGLFSICKSGFSTLPTAGEGWGGRIIERLIRE